MARDRDGYTRWLGDDDDERKAKDDLLSATITGKPRPGADDLRGMLRDLYGTNKRGGVNTAAAAKALGRSQRTVQRWITETGTQRHRAPGDVVKSVQTKVRQARTTKRGRAKALAPLMGDRKASNGAKAKITGVQGPPGRRDYQRQRTIAFDLQPEHIAALRAAYIDGGEPAALAKLEELIPEAYDVGADWVLQTLDTLEITSR